MSQKSYIEKLEADLEEVRMDRARLLEILREICVQLDLRKEELGEMIERAKDGEYLPGEGLGLLPEDFHLGLYPP